MTQSQKAGVFLDLHRTQRPLVLPNAWDVPSARIFEEAGFPALATTSAGIANLLGYPDGQHIPRSEMLDMVARIARAVQIPVTADMEAGYGDASETARGVIEAGAVGLNLEDSKADASHSLVDIGEQCAAISAVREIADTLNVPLVINARTDVFLGSSVPLEQRLDEAVRRLSAYAQAGADSLFVPGLREESVIQQLVQRVHRPLNILLTEGTPSIAGLGELGVARVTIGSGGMRATLGLVRRIARDLHDSGSVEPMLEDPMSYLDANTLLGSTR
jgi:2-methylisocitrate lyase-like PEP mutase family enzyme